MLSQYRIFRDNLQGYQEVSFRVFREELLPLRGRGAWTESQRRLVAGLHAQGAGFALQALFGAGHKEANAILGPAPPPPPMPRPALEKRLQELMRSCRAAKWRPETYTEYVKQLDSGKAFEEDGKTVPDEFSEMYRAAGAAFRDVVRAAFEKGRREASAGGGPRAARGKRAGPGPGEPGL